MSSFLFVSQALVPSTGQQREEVIGEEVMAYPVYARYLRVYGECVNNFARLKLEVFGEETDEERLSKIKHLWL